MKNITLLFISCILIAGCGSQRSERNELLDTEVFEYALPKDGKIEYEKHGEETWFAYGALSEVEGYRANGVTQSHMFEDDFYLHTVTLNIEPAPDGYFYEGWLVNGSSIVSTGHLSNPFGDVRHSLRFESAKEYSAYTKVVITLEPDDGNPAPAVHVAEGTLKVTKR